MYRVVTPADDEPISLAEAKVHLRLGDGTDEDALILDLISTAREMAEHYTGRALAPQTLEMALPAFPRCASAIELDMPPVTSVVSVKYTDTVGVEQTLDPKYRLSAFGTQRNVMPTFGNSWPSTGCDPEAVRIQYVAGYVACPDAARSAMLLTIGALYEDRETAELPAGAEGLLDTIKVYG
jgi:uncharacterized phiE125 gp8 family phage protein